MHNISGNPANYANSAPVVDDGDPHVAAAYVPAYQQLLDNTAALDARATELESRADDTSGVTAPVAFTSTSPTTWTAGPNARRIELVGYGGGGGGGGGAGGGTSSTQFSAGGGGGGASIERRVVLDVTPGTVYEAVIGGGGTGGAGGTGSGGDGGDGQDTVFRIQGGVDLAHFYGAKGGKGGDLATSATAYKIAPGGGPTDQYRPPATASSYATHTHSFCFGPGFGGEGVAAQGAQVARKGAGSLHGFTGGPGGAFGTTSTNPGGGSGGGGAAGPGGGGTFGRDGGAGSAGAGGAASTVTPTIPPNTGAGGGGGGGGGSGTTGGAGSSGLPGASGKLTLRVIG